MAAKSKGTRESNPVSQRTRKGTRVVVRAAPVSRALYSQGLPPDGTEGAVTDMPGFRGRTFLPGPGGGLIYVEFDDGTVMGVSTIDLDLARRRSRASNQSNPPKRARNQGRTYEYEEWALAEVHSAIEGEYLENRNFDLKEAQDWAEEHQSREQYGFTKNRDVFTLEANRVVSKWISQHRDYDVARYGEDISDMGDDRTAWLTWATMEGAGVGFWEHLSRVHYESLKAAIDRDKKLKKAHDELQSSIYLLAHDAPYLSGTLEENPRRNNPDARAREQYLLRGTR